MFKAACQTTHTTKPGHGVIPVAMNGDNAHQADLHIDVISLLLRHNTY